MHRRAFYAYASVYVIAIKKNKTNKQKPSETVLFSSTAIQEPVTLKCELFHPEQKRKRKQQKTVIAMQTNYIF